MIVVYSNNLYVCEPTKIKKIYIDKRVNIKTYIGI